MYNTSIVFAEGSAQLMNSTSSIITIGREYGSVTTSRKALLIISTKPFKCIKWMCDSADIRYNEYSGWNKRKVQNGLLILSEEDK